jgi:hypothetical protein
MKLFDGDLTTKWNSAGSLPNWVTWHYPSAIIGKSFTYVASGDGVHDPKSFRIVYSDDDSNWKSAGQFQGVTSSSPQTFTLATDGLPHSYWSFIIDTSVSQYQIWLYEAYITGSAKASSLLEEHANIRGPNLTPRLKETRKELNEFHSLQP